MRILLIGSQGFIGRHIMYELIRKFGKGSIFSTSSKDKSKLGSAYCREIRIEQKNSKILSEFIIESQVSIIINSAGILGQNTNDNTDKDLAKTIVNAFRSLKNKPSMIQIGSSSEYAPSAKGVESTELFLCKPISDYGKKKLEVSDYLISASNEFNFKLCICRVFNVIGPKMNYQTILGRLYQEVLIDGQKSIHFNSLSSYRDYIDVRDVSICIVKLIIYLRNVPRFSEILNVGSGNAVQVRSLIEKIQSNSGQFKFTESIKSNSDENISWQQANIDKIEALIDWKPKYTLTESIDYLIYKEDIRVR